jgi:hypothetical protein
MKVAIHQPECFPWLGFFHKIYLADIFVFLDTVQFEKNNFQNRNKIKIGKEGSWLTLPVYDHPLNTLIKDIKINWSDTKLIKKHLLTLKQNYSKSPYFEDVFLFLEQLYNEEVEFLADFNIRFIIFMMERLGIKTKTVRASELDLSGKAQGGTEVTLEICKKLGAQTYISGSGAKVYLDTDLYKKDRINVYFQEFHHPIYEQPRRGDFVSHLSILDLYFNHGPKSLEIIFQGNISSIE